MDRKEYRRIANINIEDARIMSRQGFDHDNYGKKSLCFWMDDEEVNQQLIKEGWRLHMTRPSEEYPEPRYFLPCEIKYDLPEGMEDLAPRIYRYEEGSRKRVTLNAVTVSTLAKSRIVNIDVTIRPRRMIDQRTGEEYIKGYVSIMRVTVAKEDDAFAEKYAEEEYPEE